MHPREIVMLVREVKWSLRKKIVAPDKIADLSHRKE